MCVEGRGKGTVRGTGTGTGAAGGRGGGEGRREGVVCTFRYGSGWQAGRPACLGRDGVEGRGGNCGTYLVVCGGGIAGGIGIRELVAGSLLSFERRESERRGSEGKKSKGLVKL